MRILAVDDEDLMLERLCLGIEKAAPNAEIVRFKRSTQAQEYIKENIIDVAFLDIQMRVLTGMELAKIIKQVQPSANIIFCTGYSEYMYEAISKIHCSGYIMKPVTAEQIKEELENLRIPIEEQNKEKKGIYLQCFGNFEVFLDGVPMKFGSKKAKELFAYLTDRRGAVCSTQEIIANLWDDDEDHSSYIKKCRKDLTDTLTENGYGDILEKSWGGLAIRTDKVHCDYYDWLDGTAEGINRWNGSYMDQYSWAEVTKASLMDLT